MIVTEAALREQLRHPRHGATIHVPTGAVLSPSARDFVAQWDLELREDVVAPAAPLATSRPTWDTPSTFTFDAEAAPRCTACGGEVVDKPDHLTQIDACHLGPKTHPRIVLRGQLDSLQAAVLLAGRAARDAGATTTAEHLDQVAAYVRELLAAEYQGRPAAPPSLAGLDDDALHAASHAPRGALGVDHLTPSSTDPAVVLWCNWARALSREAEVAALAAHPNPHDPAATTLVHGCNRLSSILYWVALAHVAADREGAPA